MGKYVRVSIYLREDDELLEFIKSQSGGRPLGAVVRDLLNQYMAIIYWNRNKRSIKRHIKQRVNAARV